MESVLAFLTLSALLLFTSSSVAARKDAVEYWKDVTKDQAMPEEIRGLLPSNNPGSLSSLQEKQKQEEHNSVVYRQSVSVFLYGRDEHKKENQKKQEEHNVFLQSATVFLYGHNEHKEEEIPRKEFELNNGSNSCHDDAKQEEEQKKKSFVKDFDPTQRLSLQ